MFLIKQDLFNSLIVSTELLSLNFCTDFSHAKNSLEAPAIIDHGLLYPRLVVELYLCGVAFSIHPLLFNLTGSFLFLIFIRRSSRDLTCAGTLNGKFTGTRQKRVDVWPSSDSCFRWKCHHQMHRHQTQQQLEQRHHRPLHWHQRLRPHRL